MTTFAPETIPASTPPRPEIHFVHGFGITLDKSAVWDLFSALPGEKAEELYTQVTGQDTDMIALTGLRLSFSQTQGYAAALRLPEDCGDALTTFAPEVQRKALYDELSRAAHQLAAAAITGARVALSPERAASIYEAYPNVPEFPGEKRLKAPRLNMQTLYGLIRRQFNILGTTLTDRMV